MNIRKHLLLFLGGFAVAPGLIAQTNLIAIFPEENAQTPETHRVVWASTPGVRYEVRQSTNLQSWTPVPGFPAAAPGPAQEMPFATTGTARFFRVNQLDEQPPAIVTQYPADGGFAVPRFANLTMQLSDATGVDPASLQFTLSTRGAFTLASTNLTWTNNTLTFCPGSDLALGGWGSNVVATLIMADTRGYRATNTWSFTLETQPEVATNLFVFGSPQARRAGQFVGNIPTANLARHFGPLPMSAGDPWTLELVESNRLELSYTNTAPAFALNTYICNLAPIRPADIFNRKITGISDDPANKRLTLFTEEVPLTEIVSNGTSCITADSVILETGTNGLFHKTFAIGSTVTFPRIGYSLDGAVFRVKTQGAEFEFNGQVTSSGSGPNIVSLTAEQCHAWLTPSLQASMDIGWGGLEKFEAVATGALDIGHIIAVDVLLAGYRAEEIEIFHLPKNLRPENWLLQGFIGPVPIFDSLSFDLQLLATAEARADLHFRYGFTQTARASFGLVYQKPWLNWKQDFDFPSPVVEPFTYAINGEMALELSLVPRLEFLVYGLAGASAGITPSGRITFAGGTGQPLIGSLEADARLEIELAGPAFESCFGKDHLPTMSWPLWGPQTLWSFSSEPELSFDQPPQSQSVTLGKTACFSCSVVAPQTPRYQWFFYETPFAGQTAATLLLPGVTYGHAGQYKVCVTAGSQTIESDPVTLTVTQPLSPPEITSQPQDRSEPAGGTASFSVQAQGGGTLSYRWSKNGSYLSNGGRISGATSHTLQIANVQTSDAGSYQVRVSNPAGSVNSRSASLTVPTGTPPGMALIPAGSFTMGNCMGSGEGNSNELPLHPVYVSAFYMDRYAVTKALWDEVKGWNGGNGYVYENAGAGKAANHPVVEVNWRDCVKWCNARSQKEGLVPCYYNEAGLATVYKSGTGTPYPKWAANGYRLPTEAEWEKAARGGVSGHRFPWADTDTITHSRANYYAYPSGYSYDVNPSRGYHPSFATGAMPYTSPVGYFEANGYGLYDMAGNVWEWCWDWYSSGYYSSSPGTDPRGPTSGSYRVHRGGSWRGNAINCRSANRIYDTPDIRYYSFGFRAVRPPGQ